METIIFDMDGVIIDSEIHWKKIQSDFLKGLIPTWSPQDQKQLIGLSAHDVYKRLVDKYNLELSKEEYFYYYKDISNQIYGISTNLIPGVLEALNFLKGKNIGLASSAPHEWIDIVLDRFQIRGCFKQVVSSDDVNGIGKPDPGIYELAVKKLEANKENTCAIEDSEKGVLSAKTAGIRCIAFRNGFNQHQDLSKADYEISSFKELENLINC